MTFENHGGPCKTRCERIACMCAQEKLAAEWKRRGEVIFSAAQKYIAKEDWAKRWKNSAHKYRLEWAGQCAKVQREMRKKDRYCSELEALKAKVEAFLKSPMLYGMNGEETWVSTMAKEHFGEARG